MQKSKWESGGKVWTFSGLQIFFRQPLIMNVINYERTFIMNVYTLLPSGGHLFFGVSLFGPESH